MIIIITQYSVIIIFFTLHDITTITPSQKINNLFIAIVLL